MPYTKISPNFGGIGILKIVTYNIHRAVGTDGRKDPDRILEVLRSLDADLIALQEVEIPRAGSDLLRQLSNLPGKEALFGPTICHENGDYGNVLLCRHEPDSVDRIEISQDRREPRGAIAADFIINSNRVRIIATHLGLGMRERQRQTTSLLSWLSAREEDLPSDLRIFLGDLNEWRPWGRPLRWLRHEFGSTIQNRTFPSRFPLLPLDQIFVAPNHTLVECSAIKNELTRKASDHLPLKASLQLSAPRRVAQATGLHWSGPDMESSATT